MKLELPIVLSLAIAAAPVAAEAQDVGVFSEQDADEILADPVDDTGADPAKCAVELVNGECPRTRAFSIATMKEPEAAPSQQPRQNYVRPAAPSPSARKPAPGRRATTRVSSAHEVPLQFSLGSSALSLQSMDNLKTLAAALNAPKNAGKRIRITGHTDKSGSLDVNRRLSQQRADAAADYLVVQGVDRDRIEAQGMGFDDPLPGFSIFSPRQRRVEVERID